MSDERTIADTGLTEADAQTTAITDEMLHALSEADRRETVDYLLERDRRASVSDIADHLSSPDDSEREYEKAHASLYHVHLPQLASAGIVAYDEETETTELEIDRREVEDLLDAAAEMPG
ncbi:MULTISPECIES: DUF7344 domain-containing protein [Halorussus]|uniref:DUF7344 domain-containing protein n=1 Tax=Halorussus TaxID=1070314 RepID=UPI00209EAA88|nr:hypothetical protein [Halorussus vallis]USZ76742.1 hypothetical protein NGM07_05300 [Halorussus vallis]